MTHLDDTAIVATDAGEKGIWYKMISDDILANGKWKDTTAKNKTIDLVITKHGYLKSAYTILANIHPQKKYYPYIKEMAQRDKSSVKEYDNRGFYEIQSALYGLAKFKKETDISFIKEALLSNTWTINKLSFKLMKEFPNEAYLDVYERFYPKGLYREFCEKQNTSIGIDFINTIATYKNERSARILDAILNSGTFINCTPDSTYFKQALIYAIWDNDCKAYSKIRKQVESQVKNYKQQNLIPAGSIKMPADSSTETIHGW
jgi:hypothetical protein